MTRLLTLVLAAATLAGAASAMPICHDPRSGRLTNCPHALPLPRCLGGRLCGTACIPRNKFCSELSHRPNIAPKL
jgi:hypothetical protein